MLTLTENASTVVRSIAEQSGNVDRVGLRISQDTADDTALQVIPTDTPEPGDRIVEEDGARVFLEETAANALDDKVLDARVDERGGVEFSLTLQNG